MSQPIIYINLTYPINDSKNFKIKTNAKPELVSELIFDFIHGQIGAGKDERPAKDLEVYHIDLSVDLTDDTWRTSHDTGNLGLRDGILMNVAQRIDKMEGVFDWLDDEQQGCRKTHSPTSS